ncbi:MAG: Factor arrest protein 11 [Claussenomyces sp. TS43310]|nr:MAG: Factor arrest protein 11 [Claussenomyces sp. TS43310]
MASLWTPSSPNETSSSRDNSDVADTGLADIGLPSPHPGITVGPSGRPQLQRNQPQPPPQHQPPPPPAPQQIGSPADSLSLMQLKRIVTDFPRADPTAYAFTYSDTASYEEEVDEWFSYNKAEFLRLRRAHDTFERRWKKFEAKSWSQAERSAKKAFVQRGINGLHATDLPRRCKSLQILLHTVLGVWRESAGNAASLNSAATEKAKDKGEEKLRSAATKSQIEAIKDGILLLTECGGVEPIYDVLKKALDRLWGDEFRDAQIPEDEIPLMQDELDNVTTILYMVIETTRYDTAALQSTCNDLRKLNPSIVDYLVNAVAKLRWDEANELPQTRIFLLFWKSILLVFGDSVDLDEVKIATDEQEHGDGSSEDVITASPLDYNLFRQEIISKYPAYVPPAPMLPLGLDSNSILPPLPNHPTRNNGSNGILPTPASAHSSGASILQQPVHIATPAPSPPPSPAVGGKAGKKQNYQTNQNFPFMYPPLDSTSNSAGGKGVAGLQEQLVGRRWEGSDIPTSILEAGELFAERTRMTRAMRQLWDERERFLKCERGWEGNNDENDDVDEIDLDTILASESAETKVKAEFTDIDYGPRRIDDSNVRTRLDNVETFYRMTLPHLQSLVIVLLKAVLANVTALITQPIHPGLASSFPSETNLRTNGVQAQRRPQESAAAPQASAPFDITDLPIDDLEALRSREITAKAVSGILLTLLKWFKVSHILKFEYLTQLLLDSNYLPLVLKLFAHSEIDKIVDFNSDRLDLSFFHFCNTNSKKSSAGSEMPDSEEDEAAPPPIKLRRNQTESLFEDDRLPALAFQNGQQAARREIPEIDELGYAVTDLPAEPKTDFSWRNFFSSINYLRIMQKICKHKAHRNLLLVQYKSSNILKKALKIPQHELRLYTLKLFKNQVPYCGRKWRQGNMRVITAVYLHCKPELRDDWLAGSDVDAEVEEALPLEQALRALTHWHNVKRYPEAMGADVKLMEEEHDFFMRELERMDLGVEEGLDEMGESRWDGSLSGW